MALSTLPIFSSPFLFPLKTPKPFKPQKPLTITCSSQEPKRPSKAPQRPTPRNRKRRPYGTSRRSILKKTFTQEQVKFTASVSDDPHVGIIGGGMAGLVCALSLEKRGVRSTVFDTGMHGLGGRIGTRVIDPQQLIFDHAAQFFTVSDSRFAELVDYWLKRGLVQQWQGLVGAIKLGGHFVPLPPSPPRFIGIKGMRPLADSLLSETSMVNVVRPCWISKLEPFNGMWHLSENGKPCGQFDAIVIAHNGNSMPPYFLVSSVLVFSLQLYLPFQIRFAC
ncbi:uncharacterized protein LOC110415583 isoform X1 [Herrania umbratica]|uniref:Uncharacterized protein LOC110415583 isoform X1 n=1 Tax=Herrania umbratica TaxID=108875 RepID=A0A6J1A734_9ROSI|nr:uncharacterized protein LOC110415583 isoform X1 [Herrania umbratica]